MDFFECTSSVTVILVQLFYHEKCCKAACSIPV